MPWKTCRENVLPYVTEHDRLVGYFNEPKTISVKQQKVANVLANRKNACIIHELTKIGGTERYKNESESVLA